MLVISQDTPFFLFSFATALTLQEVSIEHVTIRTVEGRIEDEFEFVDAAGRAITDSARIDRIKLSFCSPSSSPSFSKAPLTRWPPCRFEALVTDLIALPQQGKWLELLSDQGVLRDLAQLLGASTFSGKTSCDCSTRSSCPCSRRTWGAGASASPWSCCPTGLRWHWQAPARGGVRPAAERVQGP